MRTYSNFINQKLQSHGGFGFSPVWMPEFLFPFQQALVEWNLLQGSSATFADCGLGKTPMQLVWAENVVRHENKPVLILTPLAVSAQTIREGEKFGIECKRSSAGEVHKGINVTNYERLHYFNPADFCGLVCDESSIMKSFDGAYRSEITEFMRKLPYRLLCTATAAPNDYIELGTSSEALGQLGYTDMLTRFFKNDQNTVKPTRYVNDAGRYARSVEAGTNTDKWRFKGHAEIPFWRWMCSWARACRKPSDLGFDDGDFILPQLVEKEHMVISDKLPDGALFPLPAIGLKEQREERRRTIDERCARAAELVCEHEDQSLVWCHLNDEGDKLEKVIPDAVQVSGKDSDDEKEEKLLGFASGDIRVLVTKPKIGAWGLNFQKCNHITFFPSHSFEQYYQAVRRCWRFGQKRAVKVDIITTEGEQDVMRNLQRKAAAADKMFANLVREMNHALHLEAGQLYPHKEEVPVWL